MKKKAPFIVIFSLLIFIGLLFLPSNEKATTVPVFPTKEYEHMEADRQGYLERNLFYEEVLSQYYELANFLLSSIELTEDQINELSTILTTHRLQINKRGLYADTIADGPLMIELNKYISEFVTSSESPQAKEILNIISKNEDYKTLKILSEQELTHYLVDESNKKSTIFYHEDAKALRELTNELTIEVSPNLKEELYIRGSVPKYTFTIHDDTFESNEVFNDHYTLDEFLRYDYLLDQTTMIQEAIELLIHQYPNQEELYDFIKNYNELSVYVFDAFEVGRIIENEMDTSALPIITFKLDNPFLSIASTYVLQQLLIDFNDLTKLSIDNASYIERYTDDGQYLSRSYLLTVEEDMPAKVTISNELEEKLSLSFNKFTLKNKLESTNFPKAKIIPTYMDDFEQYTQARYENESVNAELSIIEGKKLLTTLIDTLPIEQQREVLYGLIKNDIMIDYISLYNLPNLKNIEYYDDYTIFIEQQLSSLLLENERYYSLIEDKIVSVDELHSSVIIEDSSHLSQFTFESYNRKKLMLFTNDLTSPFIKERVNLIVEPSFIAFSSPSISLPNKYYETNLKYFVSQPSMNDSYNNKKYFMEEEINLLKEAFSKLMEYISEETITNIVDESLVLEVFDLKLDEQIVPMNEVQTLTPQSINNIDIVVSSPLLSVLPKEFYENYFNNFENKIIEKSDGVHIYPRYGGYDILNMNILASTLSISIGVSESESEVKLNFNPEIVEKLNLPIETITFRK